MEDEKWRPPGQSWKDIAKTVYEGERMERMAVVAGMAMDKSIEFDSFNTKVYENWFSAEATKKRGVHERMRFLYIK